MKTLVNIINESQTYNKHSLEDVWNKYIKDGSPSDDFLKDLILFGASKNSNSDNYNEKETAKICVEIVDKMKW